MGQGEGCAEGGAGGLKPPASSCREELWGGAARRKASRGKTLFKMKHFST